MTGFTYKQAQVDVLILIVVEDGLVQQQQKVTKVCSLVLILIVVDNGLVLNSSSSEHEISLSLNPCCDGRWSSTEKDVAKKTKCWS